MPNDLHCILIQSVKTVGVSSDISNLRVLVKIYQGFLADQCILGTLVSEVDVQTLLKQFKEKYGCPIWRFLCSVQAWTYLNVLTLRYCVQFWSQFQQTEDLLGEPLPIGEVPYYTRSGKRRLFDQKGPSTSKKFLSETEGEETKVDGDQSNVSRK
jgi:hypothetical protein